MTQLIHMHHLEGFQAALKQNRANVKKSNTSATIKKKKNTFSPTYSTLFCPSGRRLLGNLTIRLITKKLKLIQ